MVGFDKRQQEMPAASERQAKYKLGQIMRQTAMNYRSVATKGDPNGWAMVLNGLEQLAEQLENGGEWPPTIHGMNWLWSLPWGPDERADRDLFVFWAKCEGADPGGDSGEVPIEGLPSSGAEKELAGTASAA